MRLTEFGVRLSCFLLLGVSPLPDTPDKSEATRFSFQLRRLRRLLVGKGKRRARPSKEKRRVAARERRTKMTHARQKIWEQFSESKDQRERKSVFRSCQDVIESRTIASSTRTTREEQLSPSKPKNSGFPSKHTEQVISEGSFWFSEPVEEVEAAG